MEYDKFHKFSQEELNGMELPRQFTFPFYYTPHPLCVIAARHIQDHLKSQSHWCSELQKGKMMGVLVVNRLTTDGKTETGFLAAFSGNLAHSNNYPYFVPAVYDLLSEKGFFRPEEDAISAINNKINDELNSGERKAIMEHLSVMQIDAKNAIDSYKGFMKEAKAKRDEARRQGIDDSILIAESQFQKAELKRIQNRWNKNLDFLRDKLSTLDKHINELKTERQIRSAQLQEKIFRHFVMLNAYGESRDLCDIFACTPQGTPPAGAGECAAPKLLQYAFSHSLKPIAMAEFWVGDSPKETIRKHGQFYPSCKAKCEPILNWMLQGLDVEPNPLERTATCAEIDILYEDQWILAVNKPAGVLSVPGKLSTYSLQEHIERLFPEGEKPMIVHRLDMDTSGVLLFAKDKDTHKAMQSIFKNRNIQKRYIAIIDGEINAPQGTISLPLTLNPNERPFQIVSFSHGKPAITKYETIECKNGKTRIAFYPLTGRTHQLRVHSAHPEGLNAPIVGDTLYGTHSDRLYLHAESITFTHPITGKPIEITAPCPF